MSYKHTAIIWAKYHSTASRGFIDGKLYILYVIAQTTERGTAIYIEDAKDKTRYTFYMSEEAFLDEWEVV